MEVQAHGNAYENRVICERTGMNKDDYDSLKPNGYTSEFDLSKGQIVDYNGSIKTTKNNTICCSDVVRKMMHTNYRLIVGQYNQVGKEKLIPMDDVMNRLKELTEDVELEAKND